jgi:alcohol dehydrogenase, propanol-preferring
MRAAVAEQSGHALALRDVAFPEIGPADVLMKVEACGVCYTDLRVTDAAGMVTLPRIPGHEPVGVVAAIGSEVTDLAIGDRIGAHAIFSCGACEHCRSGEEEACVSGIAQLAGLGLDGGYAEYLRLPADHAIPLPDGMAFTDAAPFFCAGLTTYAAFKNGGLQPGQRVVVIGIGGLGHLAVPLARAMGATVYAVTGSPDKTRLAIERGATMAGDVDAVAAALKQAGGAHLVLNTANSLDAVGVLAPGMAKQGAIVLVATGGDTLPLPPGLFIGRQLRLIGSFFGSRQDMREVLALAERHAIRPLVETYPLTEVNVVHARLRANQVRYRAVLTP